MSLLNINWMSFSLMKNVQSSIWATSEQKLLIFLKRVSSSLGNTILNWKAITQKKEEEMKKKKGTIGSKGKTKKKTQRV